MSTRSQGSISEEHLPRLIRSLSKVSKFTGAWRKVAIIGSLCDLFHNTEVKRKPTKLGLVMTLVLFIPCMIAYVFGYLWAYQRMAPAVSQEILWSSSLGLQPLEVECHEASACWLWVSGCGPAGESCVALQAGQRHTVPLCHAIGATAELHMRWLPHDTAPNSGLKVLSQAHTGKNGTDTLLEIGHLVQPGRHLVTRVHTINMTLPGSFPVTDRLEWFLTFLGWDMHPPLTGTCDSLMLTARQTDIKAAQIEMAAETYEVRVERPFFLFPLLGEIGGAYGLAYGTVYVFYLALWTYFSNQGGSGSCSSTGQT